MTSVGSASITEVAVGASSVSQIYVGENLVWPDLEFLEYAYFDGTTIIDTGVDQTGSPSVACDFQHTNLTSKQFSMILGCRGPGNTHAFLLVANSVSGQWVWQYGVAMVANAMGAYATNRSLLTVVGKKASITTTNAAGGSITRSATATNAIPTQPYRIFLGGGGDVNEPVTGSMFVGNMWSVQIVKSGLTVFDAVAARRRGVVGFYDRISKKFITPTMGVLQAP